MFLGSAQAGFYGLHRADRQVVEAGMLAGFEHQLAGFVICQAQGGGFLDAQPRSRLHGPQAGAPQQRVAVRLYAFDQAARMAICAQVVGDIAAVVVLAQQMVVLDAGRMFSRPVTLDTGFVQGSGVRAPDGHADAAGPQSGAPGQGLYAIALFLRILGVKACRRVRALRCSTGLRAVGKDHELVPPAGFSLLLYPPAQTFFGQQA